MATDPVSLLSNALDQAGRVIAGLDREQADLSTPCQSWTVGQLIDHLMLDLKHFTVTAAGGTPDWSEAPPPAGDDWAGEFRRGAEELLATWRAAGPLDGTTTVPGMGEVPARAPVDMQVAELAVHAWDLARATDQKTDFDPEIAQVALAWMHSALDPSFRGSEADGKSFGPEVPVAEDAPPYDRLAAFAGRDPR
jgi:uncharacterized protein (TIGR03086 family)